MFRKSFYECSDEAQFADADAAFLRLQGPGERIQIAIEPARVAEPQAIDFDAVSTVDDDDPSQPLIEQCELVVGAQAEFEDLHERVVAEQADVTLRERPQHVGDEEIGRASCRESVCQYV